VAQLQSGRRHGLGGARAVAQELHFNAEEEAEEAGGGRGQWEQAEQYDEQPEGQPEDEEEGELATYRRARADGSGRGRATAQGREAPRRSGSSPAKAPGHSRRLGGAGAQVGGGALAPLSCPAARLPFPRPAGPAWSSPPE
jgi:hypothetical protein